MRKLSFFTSVLLVLGTIAGLVTPQAVADYTLADGETKTFTNGQYGTLSQNIVGPTTGSATVIFDQSGSEDINHISGSITGNVTLIKRGAATTSLRLCNANSDFTGPVRIEGGNIYIHTGHELGTGTVYLQGGGLSDAGKGTGTEPDKTISLANNIVFEEGTTSGIRFFQTDVSFTGNLSGAGNINWARLASGYTELNPSTTRIKGSNQHSGKNNFANTTKTFEFHIYNAEGFGTGEMDVDGNVNIHYQESATTIDRNITHTSVNVANGKTLKLTNEGGGKVNITAGLQTSSIGTIDIAGSNIHLTLSGGSEETLASAVKIASGSALSFTGGDNVTTYIDTAISGDGELLLDCGRSMFHFNRDNTSLTGDVHIASGRIYLNTGKELGTGKIFLGGAGTGTSADNATASLQNNSTDIDMTNDIELVGNAYLRPYNVAKTAKFRGDFTGSGNLTYGSNVFTVESQNAQVHLYGENTYTGTTTIAQGGNNPFIFHAYGENSFGTGALNVQNNATINFHDATAGTATNHNLANSAINVTSGKTLTLTNDGAGKTDIAGTITNAGTMYFSSGTFALANAVTNNGSMTFDTGTRLEVGSLTSTMGIDLQFAGNGTVTIDGDIVLSAFSPTNSDSLTFGDTQIVEFGNNVKIFLELVGDPSAFTGKRITMNAINGVEDLPLGNLVVEINNPDFRVGINDNGQIVFGDHAALPEPATWVLLALGFAGLVFWRKQS